MTTPVQDRINQQAAIKNQISTSRGFTLFELLVAVVLLAMISTMIYSVLNVGIKFTDKGENRLLSLAREQGLLELMRRQIDSARYDEQKNELQIFAEDNILRIVTRQPLIYRSAGLVLAVYNFAARDRTVYYSEKKDFYNIEYNEEYMPDPADMMVLAETDTAISVVYDPEVGAVTAQYGEKTFEFFPKCWVSPDNAQVLPNNQGDVSFRDL